MGTVPDNSPGVNETCGRRAFDKLKKSAFVVYVRFKMLYQDVNATQKQIFQVLSMAITFNQIEKTCYMYIKKFTIIFFLDFATATMVRLS